MGETDGEREMMEEYICPKCGKQFLGLSSKYKHRFVCSNCMREFSIIEL